MGDDSRGDSIYDLPESREAWSCTASSPEIAGLNYNSDIKLGKGHPGQSRGIEEPRCIGHSAERSTSHCNRSTHRAQVLRWKRVRFVGSALTPVSDHHEDLGPCPQTPKCQRLRLWQCLPQVGTRRSSSMSPALVRIQNATVDSVKGRLKLHLERASFLQSCGTDGKVNPAFPTLGMP